MKLEYAFVSITSSCNIPNNSKFCYGRIYFWETSIKWYYTFVSIIPIFNLPSNSKYF